MTQIFKARFLSVVVVALSSMAALAATPSSAPKEGDMAASFNLGFANAFGHDFEGAQPVFTGTFEYYTTPRVSWRGLLGVTSFDADRPGHPSLDFTFLDANVLYNWERGKIHPYVTGGVGFYRKSGSAGLPSLFDESVLGLNGGGGVDWFLGTRWALEFEGTLHGLTGENPNTVFLATAGFKFWF